MGYLHYNYKLLIANRLDEKNVDPDQLASDEAS